MSVQNGPNVHKAVLYLNEVQHSSYGFLNYKKIKTNNDYNSRYKHESNKRTTIQYANTVLL